MDFLVSTTAGVQLLACTRLIFEDLWSRCCIGKYHKLVMSILSLFFVLTVEVFISLQLHRPNKPGTTTDFVAGELLANFLLKLWVYCDEFCSWLLLSFTLFIAIMPQQLTGFIFKNRPIIFILIHCQDIELV